MARRRIHLPRRVAPGTPRKGEPGAALDCLVLGRLGEEWFGLDLASLAFVRVVGGEPPMPTPRLYPAVRLRIAPVQEPPDPARPELVVAVPTLEELGSVSVRRARRLLDQVVVADRPGAPLLGTRGPSVAYVDLDGTTPSLVLLGAHHAEPELYGGDPPLVAIRFGGVTQRVPATDARARSAAARSAPRALRDRALSDELGFRPGYLLVGLDAVRDGHVRKAVLAVLPRRARGRATSEAPRRRGPRPSPSRS